MQPHLIISFEYYNEPDFLLRVETIDTSLGFEPQLPPRAGPPP